MQVDIKAEVVDNYLCTKFSRNSIHSILFRSSKEGFEIETNVILRLIGDADYDGLYIRTFGKWIIEADNQEDVDKGIEELTRKRKI